jgi:hypothetical protein
LKISPSHVRTDDQSLLQSFESVPRAHDHILVHIFNIAVSQSFGVVSDEGASLCVFKCNRLFRVYVCVIKTKINLNYLLTPRSRVLLERLTGFQLVKKFPSFYGTRKFITAFTSARLLSLS